MLKQKKVVEGSTVLYVPDIEAYAGKSEPWRAPVFYNPRATPTRDISVALARVLGGGLRVLDAMCGVGARGIRIAAESEASEVVLNDVNPDALVLAYSSAAENGVLHKVRIESVGANALFAAHEHGDGFGYVDLDPFGSAAPFLPAAFLAVRSGGILGVCSTDAANLCGNRPRALYRLYFARNGYSLGVKETGLRILVGYAVRVAASLGLAAEPVLCYYYGDYFRCHFRVERSASKAERLLGGVGYLCRHSDGWRYCGCCCGDGCSGPLWTGNLASKGLLDAVIFELEKMGTDSSRVALGMLSRLREEDEITLPYIDLHRLVRGLGISPPSSLGLVLRLRQRGYRASQTHFDGKGIKTDAPVAEVVGAAREMVGGGMV